MPISVLLMVCWLMVRQEILLVVVFDAMLGLRLYCVEQLIVFVLNILLDLLAVVEFNIVGIVILVMFFIHVMVIKRRFLPVSMTFVVGSTVIDWCMNSVVDVKVRLVLNAVGIMVQVAVSWVIGMAA